MVPLLPFEEPQPIRALEVFDDGSGAALYAGGDEFRFSSGPPFWGQIARLGPTGWQPVGAGLSGRVYALTTFDDGSGVALYAGGHFPGGVAKWDGSSWSPLGTGLSGSPPGTTLVGARALKVFDDGTGAALYVGGLFTGAGGVVCKGLAQWDGAEWNSVGGGVSGYQEVVFALAVENLTGSSRLVAGGRFTHAGTTPANNLAAWDGRTWTGFALGGGGSVNSVHAADDGTGPALYVGGGSFSWGASVTRVARWRPVGGWSPMGTGSALTATGTDADVFAMSEFDDGAGNAVVIAGRFDRAGPTGSANLAPWKQGAWRGLGTGPDGPVHVLESFTDNQGPALMIGGRLGGFGDVRSPGVVGLRDDAPVPLGSGVGGDVYALTEWDDGSGRALYAGGLFATAGGVAARNVARWDGQAWSPLGGGIPPNGFWTGAVFGLLAHDDGTGEYLFAVGNIEYVTGPGTYCYNVMRWDGSQWIGMRSGLYSTNEVYCLAEFSDGGVTRLFAGSQVTNSPTPRTFSRWDGAQWTEPLQTDPPLSIRAMRAWNDGGGPALFVAGTYQTMLRVVGTSWTQMGFFSQGTGNPAVLYALEDFNDGRGGALLIGGDFGLGTFATPVAHGNNIVRRAPGTWETLGAPPNSGTQGIVRALKTVAEGGRQTLYVGGEFSAAGGVTAGRLARWIGCPLCYPDCSGDGALTVADFGCFQTKFIAGDPYADCNADGVLSVGDFGCFQTKFVTGCP